jgi:uncharacterized repeat protein (TIGR03833 family)
MSNIELGMEVSINPQSDKTRSQLVRGIVKDILTRNQSHPHGVKVKLETGEVGRVKETHSSSEQPRSKTDETSQSDPSAALSVNEFVSAGENHFVEFKTSALWSKFYTKEQIESSKSQELKIHGQRTSSFILAKSIAGFTNADGGHLIIGIKEDKLSDAVEIVGINSELKKLKDQNIDGYRRMIVDDVISRFLPNFFLHRINEYMQMSFHEMGAVTICHLDVLKADRAVFVKAKKDQFFVRIEASTREVTGEDMINYCNVRFDTAL